MAPMDRVTALFENLDAWRHYPAYQLERRADAFFAIYLREVLAEVTGTPLSPVIIPELPLRHGTLWPDGNNQADRVDFALFAEDLSRAFLVELKTDHASLRRRQDEYLDRAREIGLRPIVDGIVRHIVRATDEEQKYQHLVAALARVGLVELPPELEPAFFPQLQRGRVAHLDRVRVVERDVPIEVVYVQPTHTDRASATCVDFEQFAGIVRRHEDPFSQTFAAHLLRWRDRAGSTTPVR